MSSRTTRALAAFAVAALTAATAVAADYAGTFAGPQLTLTLSPTGSGYAGRLRLKGQDFPCKATDDGAGHLSGKFASGDDAYPFAATLDGDRMTLTSGTKTYALDRQRAGGGGNPLGDGGGGGGGPTPPAPAARPATPQLQRYDFPDGTGSIGLPPGWTCPTRSAADPIFVNGPGGQGVAIGAHTVVQTPDSPLVQMYQQNVARARAMGMPPPPPMVGIVVAPFADPAQVKGAIMDQVADGNAQRLGWTLRFDRVLGTPQATPPRLAGGRAQFLSYAYTVHPPQDQPPARHRVDSRVEFDPVPAGGAYSMFEDYIDAPAATFDRDAPTMMAIYGSLRVNQDQLNQVCGGRIIPYRPTGGGRLGGGGGGGGGGDASHKAAEDQGEFLSGQQKIRNTVTGEERWVDYSNSDDIVQKLNDEPGSNGAWVIVHRRDE